MIHTIHTLVVSMCACVYAAAVVSIRNYDIILNGCKNKLYYYIRRHSIGWTASVFLSCNSSHNIILL